MMSYGMYYKKNGLHERVLNVLKSVYSQLESFICTDEGLSENFRCMVGTRQGCMLSPFLFVMFLNAYMQLLTANNCQGIYVTEIVNILSQFCNNYRMKFITLGFRLSNV